MKHSCCLIVLSLFAGVAACRKKPEPVPPPPPAPPAAVTPEAKEAQAASNGAMAFSNASVLTMMLQEFTRKNGRLPNDINELSTITTFGPAPQAPTGYRFVIDAAKKQVVAVAQ